MTREIHTTKAFRTDYKKLSKNEVAETDAVVQKLMKDELLILTLYRMSSHTNIFDIKKRK